MEKPLTKTFTRTTAMLVLVSVWALGSISLKFFYDQQMAEHESSLEEQVSQRVDMLSVMQAELINKEFSYIASSIKQIEALHRLSPEQVDDFAEKVVNMNPLIKHIALTDSHGEVYFSTREGYLPSVTDREYFEVHKRNKVPAFYFSSLHQTMVQESARYILVSYPIHDEGVFQGVIITELKGDDLTAQLGKISSNQNISAQLTDLSGKIIWSSSSNKNYQNVEMYSQCDNNRIEAAQASGIHRIKVDGVNAQCDIQYLSEWGMYSIIAEDLDEVESTIVEYQQNMISRKFYVLTAFTLLMIALGIQAVKQIASRQKLDLMNKRNQAIIGAMPDLLMTINQKGKIIDHEVQESFPMAIPSEKLNGSYISATLTPELAEKKLRLIEHTLKTGELSTFEYPMSIDGQEHYFIERITALSEKYVLAFIVDITHRREAERRLEWLAYHDDLTGLANRVKFFEFLNHLTLDHRRTKRNFAVLYLDLNGFKDINDQYGHQVGDELLKHVAHKLTLSLRQTDTIARLGGDEFAILLPETTPEQAQKVMDTVSDTVKIPFDYNGSTLSVTASIGMSACPYDAVDPEVLLNAADNRMYAFKNK